MVHIMKRLYIGISLFILLSVLLVGLYTIVSSGIPEIGIRSFIKGEYSSQFHTYLSENLPFSEELKEYNLYLNGVYTFAGFSQSSDTQILVPIVNDAADHGTAISPSTTVEAVLSSTSTSCPEEAPTLTVTEPTTEATESTTETEEAVTESDPVVESLGQILLVGDRAIELPVADYDAISNYAQAVNRIAASMENVNTYSILVPNAAGLYAPTAYQSHEDSQHAMIDHAYNAMDDSVGKVDAFQMLEERKDEYLYFRTDHHWTHLGSYYAYKAFCYSADMIPQPLTNFQTGSYERFLGTMYSFLSGYPQREILRDNPDYLTYYIPYRDTTVKYYDSADMSYGGTIDILYPLSESYSNKYICFLGGDHPITVIDTNYPKDRVCLLIKESYGNAFATWLTSHYSRIICVDPREFNRNGKPALNIADLADEMGVDDCIILNYPLMINSSAYGSWLSRMTQ